MPYSIAVAGKGGTGKTTIAGLAVRFLVDKGLTPVLALDADANANLGDVLGVHARSTVGAVREDVLDKIGSLPPGMTKEAFMELKIQEALEESKGFDLLVMGRPEGPGCYCYANSIFRKYIDMIADNYRYIVLDNEAGMEHLSRRMTQDIDLLIIVSDATKRGVESAARISGLVDELKLRVDKRCLIINRVPEKLSPSFNDVIKETGIDLGGVIPEDAVLAEFDMAGQPLFHLPADSIAVACVADILHKYKVA